MSIKRGANTMVASSSVNSRLSSSKDSNRMEEILAEMRRLMKENTQLKHENIKLKQQVMVQNIEVENLKIKLQEQTIKTIKQKENKHRKEKWQAQSKKPTESDRVEAKKFVMIEPESTSASMVKPNTVKWASRPPGNKTTLRRQENKENQADFAMNLNHRHRSCLLKKENQSQPCSATKPKGNHPMLLSKKQSIMSKYQPFLDIQSDSSSQRSFMALQPSISFMSSADL